jgi:oligoribonuclease
MSEQSPRRGQPAGEAGTRSTDRIVWIDCEMTGLELDHDALVEVACIVTDAELVELDEGVSIVICPPDDALERMPDVVRAMHTSSGLLSELAGGTSLGGAEAELLAYVKGHVGEPGKAQLAGSSVYVDRGFLARDMPELDRWLHYRLIDVSSLKELARRWYPRIYFNSPPKHGGHRALADIRESIAELRYYRQTMLVAPPGPDSATAKAVAAQQTTASGPSA